MQRKSVAEMECPIARSLEQIGDVWSLLLLRNAFLGQRRFQEFQERLQVPPNTLTRRLRSLTEHGLLMRRRYRTRPPREEYELTPKGKDLLPVLLTLASWGNRWLAPQGAPLQCSDPRTGKLLRPVVVDRKSGRRLRLGQVALRPGPGASADLRQKLRRPLVLGGSSQDRGQP